MKYIGKTGLIQQVLQSKTERIASGQSNILERRLLFTGYNGVGKSALARDWACELVGTDNPRLNVEEKIGSDVNAEVVRRWMEELWYRPMTGRCFVKIVNEIDSVTSVAINALRQYLDELSGWIVFIGTTNKTPNELPGPLQSRFQVWKFIPVPVDELAQHLVAKFGAQGMDMKCALKLARDTLGCVRAAEEDAQVEMDILAIADKLAA